MASYRSRRGCLAVAGGLMLAGVGAGLAWRRSSRQSAALSANEADFWRQQFKQLDESTLSMALFRGKPLLVNFWATWCPPCVEELPLLDAFFRQNKANGWQVIGLAVDQMAPVARFLGQRPLSFPVALAGFGGIELGRSLGNLNGGLPFSVVFDASGALVYRKLGKLSSVDLQGIDRQLAAAV